MSLALKGKKDEAGLEQAQLSYRLRQEFLSDQHAPPRVEQRLTQKKNSMEAGYQGTRIPTTGIGCQPSHRSSNSSHICSQVKSQWCQQKGPRTVTQATVTTNNGQ